MALVHWSPRTGGQHLAFPGPACAGCWTTWSGSCCTRAPAPRPAAVLRADRRDVFAQLRQRGVFELSGIRYVLYEAKGGL
ncbi:MAG: hypothetical protein ACM3ML_33945, partial [Micromonosporaceae bacterium]